MSLILAYAAATLHPIQALVAPYYVLTGIQVKYVNMEGFYIDR